MKKAVTPAGMAGATILFSLLQSTYAAAQAPQSHTASTWAQCMFFSTPDAQFNCLQAHEFYNIGNVQFEEQLALAARQSGRDSYASVVLQRILWKDPQHAGARLDLAVTALKMGDIDLVKEQLHRLRSLESPPPEAHQLINTLSQMLTRPQERYQHSISILAGYDTNANLGIQDRVLSLSLNDEPISLSTADSMRPEPSPWLETGMSLRYPLSTVTDLQLHARAQQFTQATEESNYQLLVGINHKTSAQQQVSLNAHLLDLNDGSWLTGLNARLQRQLGCTSCIVSAGASLHDSSQPSIGPLSLHIGLTHHYQKARFGHTGEVSVVWQQQQHAYWGSTLSLNLASELYRQQEYRKDYARVTARISTDQNPYSPLFGPIKRDTRFYGLSLGSRYNITPQWAVGAQLDISRQLSEIPLYRYDREQLSISLTWTP